MGRGVLSDVKILDFSWAWAGPYASTALAFFGAEVIKVETAGRPDFLRAVASAARQAQGAPLESFGFLDANLGKRCITLNLSLEKAQELAHRLVALSDVVVDGFRPGVAERMGLSYAALRKVREDIIVLSTSSMGQKGPEAAYGAYASNFCSLSGLGEITGYEDGPPTEVAQVMDITSAMTSAVAILLALHYRRLTGKGQWIDLSSRESITCAIGHMLLEYTMNGRNPRRQGNRDAFMAPHNCYPCRETNRWVSIAVASDEEWQALCRAMGNPSWAQDPKFSDQVGRWQHQEELDRLISSWTSSRSHIEAMELLQQHGVAAVASFTAEDLCNDPHLKERGMLQKVLHPVVGPRLSWSPPWRLSATPGEIRSAGPLLGEHNDEVFGKMLGMDTGEIERLKLEGVIQ